MTNTHLVVKGKMVSVVGDTGEEKTMMAQQQSLIKPMLLVSLSKNDLKNINPNDYWGFEKYDGFRAVWDKGRFYGRSLEKWDYYFPEMMEALQPYQNCVLDGELINSNGVCKSHLLQPRLKSNPFHIKVMAGTLPARFMIFDILEKDGQDLRNLPFEKRQYILQETIKENVSSHWKSPL